MKFISSKLALPRGLGLLVSLAVLGASVVYTQAQSPFAPPTNPMAQRNALNLLLNQVNWFQNGARSASSYPGGGYGLLVQQFQAVRNQYNFKNALMIPCWVWTTLRSRSIEAMLVVPHKLPF